MTSTSLRAGLAAALCLVLSACHKNVPAVPPATARAEPPKPVTVAVVQPGGRSASFLAVNRQLELGGTVYGYVDVSGDALKLADAARTLVSTMAQAQPQLQAAMAPLQQQDFRALVTTLGLTDIEAIGLSSVPDGTGYFSNRVFLYIPGERHGLLRGFGGQPGPFTHLNLAPADADLYLESEVDLPAVYRTFKQVVAQTRGEAAAAGIEDQLRKAGEAAAFSFLDLFNGLKGRAAFVLRLDDTRTMKLPPPGFVLPAVSALVCIDGVGPVVERALAKSAAFHRSDVGAFHHYELAAPSPLPGLALDIATEGTTLYLATDRAFLLACRDQPSGLAQSPAFQAALTHVGGEGNGLTYVSPAFIEHLRRIETLNPSLPAANLAVVRLITASLPHLDRPLVSVRTNLPDGILVRSYLNRSLKQDLVKAGIYNPMTVGLISAMAIPAFQKVRQASQEKAVLNNLRALSAAADQFYLERGVTAARYSDLVGPDKYLKALPTVAGENYRLVRFQQGRPLQVVLSDGRLIEYGGPGRLDGFKP